MNSKILWITQTAILVALLVVMQAVTSVLNNTLITGSIVNLILIVSVMLCGLKTAASVAVLSPVFAKLFGIGPLWGIVPFVMLGNLAIITVWYLLTKKELINQVVTYSVACVLGAVVKFIVIYLGVVKLAVPIILALPEPQATVISSAFSVPQLFTALIGGAISVLIVPVLKKAVKQ